MAETENKEDQRESKLHGLLTENLLRISSLEKVLIAKNVVKQEELTAELEKSYLLLQELMKKATDVQN